MPIAYEIRPEIDCIFITLSGVVENAELVEAQSRMFRDPMFIGRGHFARLIDASGCDHLEVDGLTVYFVARCAVQKGLQRAALVASSDVIYGLMRMYEGYTIEAECQVFRDVPSAARWLSQTHRVDA